MSLTYGYNPNDGDDLMVTPIQATEMLSQVILPGAVLVNHLPFCTVPYLIDTVLVSHGYSQCGIFIHGFRFSATDH